MAIDTEELWQAYDEQARPLTSAGITRSMAYSGVLHGAAHVWIWRKAGDSQMVLLQKRADDKSTWPGFLDVSAGGHMLFGEHILDTACREVKEEIGLSITADQLRFACGYRHRTMYGDIIENEIVWMYTLEITADDPLQFEDGEVSSVQWTALDDLKAVANGDPTRLNIVPKDSDYYLELFRGLERHAGIA